MQDHIGKGFGLAIAFVGPGMIALYGASLHIEVFRNWLGIGASAQPATVGGFLFAVVSAAAIGVLVSNLRWLVLERWIWRRKPPELAHSRRRDTGTELVYQHLVAQYYVFYLCSANSLFALVLLYAAWLAHKLAEPGVGLELAAPAGVLIPAGGVLYAAAKDSLNRYSKRRTSLLESAPAAGGNETG